MFILVQSKNVFLYSIEPISDFKSLSRAISLVENNSKDAMTLLQSLTPYQIPIIGVTGPPGAGKSTLINAILHELLSEGKNIGMILIDPSSPFHFGALLGDRLRMTQHFTNPNIFIRSVASRGSLGGLSDKIIEITEVMKSFPFDYIFIETVGVGQSEVEIAGLADTTVVVLVPEAGDSIQAMKAGLMEIANVFVVNKADRPDAEAFYNNLSLQLHINQRDYIPVMKTIASESQGIKELIAAINMASKTPTESQRKMLLMANKVYRLIQSQKMADFDKTKLLADIESAVKEKNFSLYRFAKRFF